MDIPSPGVTVILDFKGARSTQSVREMERESSLILKASGLNIGWKLRGEAVGETYTDLVVMTFKGSCSFDPAPPLYDELGPFATTRTVNGEVQPFGEVDCDRVVNPEPRCSAEIAPAPIRWLAARSAASLLMNWFTC